MEFGKSIVVALLGLSWILSMLLILCSIVIYFNTLGVDPSRDIERYNCIDNNVAQL